MTRWLPFPPISLALLAMWLLLNQSLSPAHLILGSVLAVIGPLALTRLDLPPLTVRRPLSVVRLLFSVFDDVVRSNFKVARVVLFSPRERVPGFVKIPLQMQSPYGLAVLACIITATPGTAWVSYNPADGILVVHVLDLVDDDDWAAIIKHRYERLLMEVFE